MIRWRNACCDEMPRNENAVCITREVFILIPQSICTLLNNSYVQRSPLLRIYPIAARKISTNTSTSPTVRGIYNNVYPKPATRGPEN